MSRSINAAAHVHDEYAKLLPVQIPKLLKRIASRPLARRHGRYRTGQLRLMSGRNVDVRGSTIHAGARERKVLSRDRVTSGNTGKPANIEPRTEHRTGTGSMPLHFGVRTE